MLVLIKLKNSRQVLEATKAEEPDGDAREEQEQIDEGHDRGSEYDHCLAVVQYRLETLVQRRAQHVGHYIYYVTAACVILLHFSDALIIKKCTRSAQ